VTNGAAADGDTPAGVLVCDDNDAIRELLGTIVNNDPGLRVVGEAADGNEAIVEAIALQPDVILLDLAMPKRSGLEALPELRRVAPDARIVVLSGFTTANVAEEVIALGAASYVEKGADPAAIVAAIQQAVAPPTLAAPT
jgi:DNA-binding NarL/FixJ family response regulator